MLEKLIKCALLDIVAFKNRGRIIYGLVINLTKSAHIN
jgi:hypothetical protein